MMRYPFVCLFLLLSIASAAQVNKYDPNLKLWYTKPASIWEEALPLGNAKTGAMVFGGVGTERFQLNDNTLWSGAPVGGNNPAGPAVLPQVRKALVEGRWDSAATLWKKMQGPYSARYLTMGDLWLRHPVNETTTTDYYRDLDLNNAVATTRYTLNGVRYKREALISFPHKVMVIRITADKKGALNFTTGLTSKLKYQTTAVADNYLVLKGKAPKYVAHRESEPEQVVYDEGEGMNFEIHVKAVVQNGTVKKHSDQLIIQNADAVTLYLTAATSFNGFDKSPGLQGVDPSVLAKRDLQGALTRTYDQIKQTHVRDYQALFHRVRLDLGQDLQAAAWPTDKRLYQFAGKPTDNGLVALYYQFGRYLMIASSRPGSRATNLQGIWNDHVQPPWGSNYTTNINTQMNYWLAENTNLSECHQPLFDFMKELAVNGARTAKVNYNIQQGWTVHHNSDIWAKTSPTGGYDWDPKGMPRWSAWPMGGAWSATHLWEHYLYTGDRKFLKEEAYPLMKGAAQFLLGWLVEDPNSDYLVTAPSTSPENTVKINGKEYQVSIASTMDMSIIRELFTALIKTSEILEVDAPFRKELVEAKARLYPYHIGKYGQLQEWFKDWDDPKDQHRHLSHLFGLYPGSQITVKNTPELAAAAKQSLLHRGDVSTGWSMAWKMNWWARLQDGEHAYKILSSAFTYINPAEKRETMGGGGTYPNLLDAHPPFQIDGNFGATAGITEMLLQSHDGTIFILPALPKAWHTGSVSGIKARGNFTLAIKWQNGKLVQSTLYSALGGNCRIRTLVPVKVVEVSSKTVTTGSSNPLLTAYEAPVYKKHAQVPLQEVNTTRGYLIDFKTEKGKTYTLVPLVKELAGVN